MPQMQNTPNMPPAQNIPQAIPNIPNPHTFHPMTNIQNFRAQFNRHTSGSADLPARIQKYNEIQKKLKEKEIPYIKSHLEGAKYNKEMFYELKRISRCLSNEHTNPLLWKEALNRLSHLLTDHGMTYHEAKDSNISK